MSRSLSRFARPGWLGLLVALGLLLAACGGQVAATPTLPPPTITPTPRSTALPPVATQVPLGSAARPYRMIFVPPAESAATGLAVEQLLNSRLDRGFSVEAMGSAAEALDALCSGQAGFAWVDGWTLLAAQMGGCASPVLKLQRDGKTGIRSEIVISPASNVRAVSGFAQRDYCRVLGDDDVHWILPTLVMRAGNFDPFTAFNNIRRMPDSTSMLREVAENRCVGGLQAGELAAASVPGYDIQKAVAVLEGTTSPELPFGGMVIAPTVPGALAAQVIELLEQNLDVMTGLVEADAILPVESNDYAQMVQLLERAGLDLKAMAR